MPSPMYPLSPICLGGDAPSGRSAGGTSSRPLRRRAWVSCVHPSWGSDTQARVPDRVQATWTFSPVILCLPEYSSGWSFQDQH